MEWPYRIRRYFLTGLLVLVPAWGTFLILRTLLIALDGLIVDLFGPAVKPGIPGLGAVSLLGLILLTGVIATQFLGQRMLHWAEGRMQRIPVVRSIYTSVKQVADTLFSGSGNAFSKALLVQYPREGSWTIAFLTGTPGGEVTKHLTQAMVSVYVPTTPNPTSGFFLMMPQADVIELDMSVDDALKYIISMGVVVPGTPTPKPPAALASPQSV